MLDYTDDVNGTIVGTSYVQAFLSYKGKKQGNTIYAKTEEECYNIATKRLEEIKKECGSVFKDIYPLNAWEVKFI